ncbi:hypothetical protein [Pseudomonas sp. NFACC46-3]|uniref:hypothetical protein n=1 Tax=Pseudomonas sp. NFACC46-3 TaxID=1566200 RepID=UPI0008F3362D|nr:hypothetical protein [Pseudomonas sp. NFACC46-3]SFL20840.1 hypothetical protein SAMN03159307_01239 [Pseudomonas sp. NFACC46-3]
MENRHAVTDLESTDTPATATSEKGPEATWYKTLQIHLGSNPGTIIFATLFFFAFAGLIWSLTSTLSGGSESEEGLNRLIALLGALLGWGVGVLFAPLSKAEKEQFQGIAKVVSAFVAGYLLSKVEVFIKLTLFPEGTFPAMNWIRVGIFLSTFLLGALIVFIHRLYAFRK